MLQSLGGKGIEGLLHGCLSIQVDSLRKELWEEDGVQNHPVAERLWMHKVSGGGAKEDLCDQEADIGTGAGKSSLGVDGNNCWWFRGSSEGKLATIYPRGLFRTVEWQDISWKYLGVALLVIIERFGKSVHTRLKLTPFRSPERINSWIQWRLQFKICYDNFIAIIKKKC